ncbi:MAG: methylated-DNA--[protein]-cysteine S-methyltransferase [Candidatus Hydrogenedentes bacterium]|nr:methylated-DNA--[protein]-cysteine S-methyltransferase [Candidatus Hydrogenedentota bacterium]
MTMQAEYLLFPTALGRCALAWRLDGTGTPRVTGFQLPESTEAQTEGRIARAAGAMHGEAPPASIQALVAQVQRHLSGEPQDFQQVPLDLDGVAGFARQVYAVAQAIPAGETLTYGEVAAQLGQPGAARAVGQALGRNPIALIIPCHRVLAAGGKPGGFSAHGGASTKEKLLAIEGAVRGGGQLELGV